MSAAIEPDPPRSGVDLHRARFLRPREPAFWVYLVLVVMTGFVAIAEQSVYRRISPTGWLLSWVLLLLYSLPVFLLIYALDLYEREPVPLLVASLVWGAVAATTLAGLANAGWGLVVAQLGGPAFASRWTATLTAPFVEEILKGLGVVLVYLIARDEFDDMMDGFVYGAVCGLGFAVVEDVFYFMGVFGGTTAGVVQGFFVRVVASGIYSHVLYSGLVGMGIGYFVSRREARSLGERLAVLAGLCTLAVLGHLLWNSPWLDVFPPQPWSGADWLMIPVATAVKGLPLLAFVVLALWLARGRERRWLTAALGEEVELGAITPEELAVLLDPKRRREARRTMRRRAGSGAASLLRRLQREQVNLAMAGDRVATGDDPLLVRLRSNCRSLRAALEAIPGAAPADSGAGARAGGGSLQGTPTPGRPGGAAGVDG
jgi:RsiW-degrading membrane proteinase PrsW (M82 family)